MMLVEAVETYVTLRRALGAVFGKEERILRQFARAVGNIPLDAVDRDATHVFCVGTGPPTPWSEYKHRTLRKFFAYLIARRHMSASPLTESVPRHPQSFEPYIYSHEELQRLLDSTAILENSRSRLQHKTFRTLLLTLYGAGLRPSEGLRLRYCDVDLDDRVLAIWDTKFFKSRLVPVGTALSKALDTYRRARECLPLPAAEYSAFFASRTGREISLNRLEKVFARLREHAKLERLPGSRWKPRLHDLRHTFAVHRLVAWYREGADVQACLPLLSTYLGHLNLSGTQAYLTMTPELLDEASKLFERYAALCNEENDHV